MPQVSPISVYIIAYNEAEKVADAIRSVAWADEVVVADSHSTDDTVRIAESLGARVVQIPFQGFGRLRNDAVAACTHEWVFSLDSDERCTPEAAAEIRALVNKAEHGVYFVPRRNFFWGAKSATLAGIPITASPSCFASPRWVTTPARCMRILNSHQAPRWAICKRRSGSIRSRIWPKWWPR